MAVARAVLSAISRFVSAMAMLNFGGQQTVSTSVQNFVRMTLRKRSFVCSIPPRLQVLRPPIQPNHRLVNPRARTDPAGWHDLAQCWREIRGPPALPGAFAYSITSPAWASGACQSPSGVSAAFTRTRSVWASQRLGEEVAHQHVGGAAKVLVVLRRCRIFGGRIAE